MEYGSLCLHFPIPLFSEFQCVNSYVSVKRVCYCIVSEIYRVDGRKNVSRVQYIIWPPPHYNFLFFYRKFIKVSLHPYILSITTGISIYQIEFGHFKLCVTVFFHQVCKYNVRYYKVKIIRANNVNFGTRKFPFGGKF